MEKKSTLRLPRRVVPNDIPATVEPASSNTRKRSFSLQGLRIPVCIKQEDTPPAANGASDQKLHAPPAPWSLPRSQARSNNPAQSNFHVYDLVSDLDALQADESSEGQIWRDVEEALRKLRAGADIVARLRERALDEQVKVLVEPFNVVHANIAVMANLFDTIQIMHRVRVENAERVVQRAMAVMMGATPVVDGAGEDYELELGNDALLPYDTTERLNLSTFET